MERATVLQRRLCERPLHKGEVLARKAHLLVFDDFVTNTTVYTRPELNEQLGMYDKIAIQAIVDQVTTAGTITVRVQHSADGINWTDKNATAEINGASISANATNKAFGSDAGATPTLGQVRLSIALTTTVQAHVKLWVTLRDEG